MEHITGSCLTAPRQMGSPGGAEEFCYNISRLWVCSRLDAGAGPDTCPDTAANLEKELDKLQAQLVLQPTLVYEGHIVSVTLGFLS